MKQRIITAAIMIAILCLIVFVLPILFTPFVILITGIAVWEWCRIAKIAKDTGYYIAGATALFWLLGVASEFLLSLLLLASFLHYLYAIALIKSYEKTDDFRISDKYLCTIGPVIIAALSATTIQIFNHTYGEHSDGAISLAFIIMVIAAADSGAYFVGRKFGTHKLAPRVSPKKTLEGLLGGFLSVLVVVGGAYCFLDGWDLSPNQILLIALVTMVFSVIGDLFISIIKRQNDIKDASQILPGHGGILDRIDGLLAGIPAFYFLQAIL